MTKRILLYLGLVFLGGLIVFSVYEFKENYRIEKVGIAKVDTAHSNSTVAEKPKENIEEVNQVQPKETK